MPSLPTPSVSPPDVWGAALNAWLLVVRNADGTLKDEVVHPATLKLGGSAGMVPVQDGAGGWTWVDPATQAELDTHKASGDHDTHNDARYAAIGATGAFLTPVAVKTANYNAAAGDLVPVDTTSGNVTVTLPNAPADKTMVAVKHVIQGGSNAVTIARNGAGTDVFNKTGGSTSLSMKSVLQSLLLEYRAANGVWYVVATDEAVLGLGTTKGDILAFDAAGHLVRVPAGATDGDILTTDGSVAAGVRMATPRPPTIIVPLSPGLASYTGTASPTRTTPDSVNDQYHFADLTGCTQAKLSGRFPTAFPASTKLAAQYNNGGGWRYFETAQDDAMALDATVAATADTLASQAPSGGWAPIETGARQEVAVRLVLFGGAGAAAGGMRSVALLAKA